MGNGPEGGRDATEERRIRLTLSTRTGQTEPVNFYICRRKSFLGTVTLKTPPLIERCEGKGLNIF